jgi:HEAT repeat protein
MLNKMCQSTRTTHSNTYLIILHYLLDRHFNPAEIRALCSNFNIDYESISHEEKPSRIRKLLLALGRNGRLPELVALAQQERQHAIWLPVPDDFQMPESLTSGDAVPPIQYHIYGDVVQGDKISVGNIEGSVVAIGKNAIAIQVVYRIETPDFLATYVDNKLTEWAKPETTTHHIPLAATISPDSLKQELENKDKPVSWSSIPEVEGALDTFNGCFVLLGASGSGKSTLLRKIAYQTALNYKQNPRAHLPVYLKLSQWPESIEFFEDFLKEELYRETEHRNPVSVNKMLLLLDGLNEMSGDIAVKRKSIEAFLKDWNVDSKTNGGMRIIASCRHYSYTEAVALDLPRVVIEPLTPDQIQNYLKIHGIQPLDLFDDVPLAKQPFYLAILVEEYKENKSIIENPAQLLEKFIERLWERERDARIRPYARKVPDLSFFKPALAQLGYDIQVRDKGTAVSAELALQSFLEAPGMSGKPPGKMWAWWPKANRQIVEAEQKMAEAQQNAEFLLRVSENAGILKIGQGTQVEFDHEKLQEFFAAYYLYRDWKHGENRRIYQYLGETQLSHTEQYREQGHWDEVWFTFADLCNGAALDTFIEDITDKEPFLAAEIASRIKPDPDRKCFDLLITKLIIYAYAEEKCDKWWNCRKSAIYALGNFTTTEAINAIAHLLYESGFYRVSRAALWRIGQQIGIQPLLQHMQDGHREGDDSLWGLFAHIERDDCYFTFEFFKFQWLFDEDLYKRDEPLLDPLGKQIFEYGLFSSFRDWSPVTEVFVSDIQEVIKLIEQASQISRAVEILAHLPDRLILEACLRVLPHTPAIESIVSVILNHPALTSKDILYLLQYERTDIRKEIICGINPKVGIPVKHELLNQPDIAFRLVQLWHSLVDEEDRVFIDARWALVSIEPAYVLPVLAKFLHQTDISAKKAKEVIDKIMQPLITNHPFSYENNYEEIGDWFLARLPEHPSREENGSAIKALCLIKPPAALPVFIKLARQGWPDCIDALAEMELGEYAEEAKEALLLALRNHRSGLAAMVLAGWKVSEAMPILISLAQEGSQNKTSQWWEWWGSTQSRIVTALSLFEDHLSENIEVFKMELKIVPIAHKLNYRHDLEPSIRAITTVAPEDITGVLIDFLDRFCTSVGQDGEYSYLRWGPMESTELAQTIREVINFFGQVESPDDQSIRALKRTTTILYDIVKHRHADSVPGLGFDKTLIAAIQLLANKQVETAVPLFRDMLNDSKLRLNIWETIIPALGQIGTVAAIIVLCDVYKNRKVVYQEWDHDTLSGLATKAIVEIGTKPALDICFSNLYAIDSPPEELSHDEWFWLGFVGKEIRAIEQPPTLEHLIQAWVDTHSQVAQDLIATTCLVHMPECVPFIKEYAIPCPERRVRFYALRILNKFDIGQASDGIYSLCRDRDKNIRQLATGMLAGKRDVRAIDSLAKLIMNPPQITDNEWDGFMEWDKWNRGDNEWNRFMWWIRPMTKGYILRYSGDYTDDISDFLNDKAFRKAATNLLIEIDDPKTDEVLKSLSNKKDPELSSWGKYGLQKRKTAAKRKEPVYSVPPLQL